MKLSPASLEAATLTGPSTVGGAPAPAAPRGGGFSGVWARVMPEASAQVQVQAGDTLIGLVKAHHRQQGLAISESQAYRLAHQVAADNGIANPDLILVGQQVDFGRLQLPPLARAPASDLLASTEQALAQRHWATASAVPQRLSADRIDAATEATDPNHPVLERTLARAVDKGFLPASDLPAVRARVLALSERYRFAPDDFARLTLMESGGMNPRASNGHCHGIIQFCDGPGRGAASVGLRENPRAILGMGLLQQLELVDRYFAQTGLGQGSDPAKIGLDELYLTVLTPAARAEKRRHAALDIAGPQASYLHVDRDRQKPITRDSIMQGLYAYTNAVLHEGTSARRATQQYAQTGKTDER